MRQFENLREQLLRAGIPPRPAKRYITELREHLADLERQERATGRGEQQARQRAVELLGSDQQLAEAMIRATPRSLAARAPWSVLALLPVLLLVFIIVGTNIAMMNLVASVRGLAVADWPSGYTSLIAVVSFLASYLIGPLLAAGCIVAALRQRLSSRWLWVGLALIALISGFLGFHMHFVPAADGGPQGPVFSALGVVWEQGRPDPAATLSLALLRAALLFAMATFAYRLLKARLIHTGSEA
jgi:hypothetical protein